MIWRIGLDSEIDPKIAALLESLGVGADARLGAGSYSSAAAWRPAINELSGFARSGQSRGGHDEVSPPVASFLTGNYGIFPLRC